MTKYQDTNTLYTSKLNSDLSEKSIAKMKKADWHSMRLDIENPNHNINLEINNLYRFFNPETQKLEVFDVPRLEDETDKDYYERRLKERQRHQEEIYKVMKEEQNENLKHNFNVDSPSQKTRIKKLKEQASQRAADIRKGVLKTLDKNIQKLNTDNPKDLKKFQDLTKKKQAVEDFCLMLSNKDDEERKNLTQENFDKVIKDYKSALPKIGKRDQDFIDKITEDFKKYKVLNNTKNLRGSTTTIVSSEILIKTPDDNNINIPPKLEEGFGIWLVKELYPNNNILYVATHCDENPNNSHTHVKMSGFNNKTKKYDLMDQEIEYFYKNIDRYKVLQKTIENIKDENIKYAEKELEELEKAEQARIKNNDPLSVSDQKELEELKKILNDYKTHFKEFSPNKRPTYTEEDEQDGKGKKGDLKKWKHYTLPEQRQHGVVFQAFVFAAKNKYLKKHNINVNYNKRTLEQILKDKHNYHDRKSPILYRAMNGQTKAQEATAKAEQELIKVNDLIAENQKILEDQNTLISDNETTITNQTTSISNNQETIENQNTSISDNEKTITDQNTLISDNQKSLEQQKTDLENNQNLINTQNKTKKENEEYIEKQESRLKKLKDSIKSIIEVPTTLFKGWASLMNAKDKSALVKEYTHFTTKLTNALEDVDYDKQGTIASVLKASLKGAAEQISKYKFKEDFKEDGNKVVIEYLNEHEIEKPNDYNKQKTVLKHKADKTNNTVKIKYD